MPTKIFKELKKTVKPYFKQRQTRVVSCSVKEKGNLILSVEIFGTENEYIKIENEEPMTISETIKELEVYLRTYYTNKTTETEQQN